MNYPYRVGLIAGKNPLCSSMKHLARIIQATDCESNRYSLCVVRRLMLANSLTFLGEARTALMEAVRARQELRHAICRKTPDHVRMRIMTSDVFTTNVMSDQTWSVCHTLLASVAPTASAPRPKPKGDNKPKSKAFSRTQASAHHLPSPPQAPKPSGTQGKGKPFFKKGEKGPPTSSATTSTSNTKPTTSTPAKN